MKAQTQTETQTQSIYAVHPAVAYCQAIIDNLPAKTGRSLQEWLELVQKEGPAGVKERQAWLKQAYDLGGTTASLIAERAAGESVTETDAAAYLTAAYGYVEALYAGPKAALRPIHEALLDLGRALGDDVKVSPCKTFVPLYRRHVFAQIKPTTRTRVDLGLALKHAPEPLPARLLDTGGLAKGDRITHRIPLAAVAEIDVEVERWLKAAYDLDG